ncbi:hypothetical protein Tco_0268645 [Tanacetum coccineum]
MFGTDKISRQEFFKKQQSPKKWQRQICPPHENTKRDPGSRQRKVQTPSSNDNNGEKRNASKFYEIREVGKRRQFFKEMKQSKRKDQEKTGKEGRGAGKDNTRNLMVQDGIKDSQTKDHPNILSGTDLVPPRRDEDGSKGPMVNLRTNYWMCLLVLKLVDEEHSHPHDELSGIKEKIQEAIPSIKYPEQTISTMFYLNKEGRKKYERFTKEKPGYLRWKPAEKTGLVPLT